MGFGMGASIILGIILAIAGAFGIPMGMPPGPEDPLMTKVAPEDCLFYASWSGVAKVDPAANPTEKWMSQPKTSKLIPKLRKAYRSYVLGLAEKSDDQHYQHLNQLIVEVMDAASVRPAAFYLDGIKLDLNKPLKANGAAIVSMGESEATANKLIDDLIRWHNELEPNEASALVYEPIEIDGKKGLKIFSGVNDRPVFTFVRDGYFILGLGEGSVQKAIANMKTAGPKWLLDLRAENKVERTASVAYLNGKLIDNMLNKGWLYDPFWTNTDWLKGVQSVGWVCGLDSKGFVAHTSIRTDKNQKSLFALIDQKSIPKRDLKHIPADVTLGLATRLSTEQIMKLIRDSFRSQSQKQMYDDTLKQLEELSGVSLEKELLNSVGSYVYAYYDFELANIMGGETDGWVVSVKIKDEMSFPEYLRQINKSVKNWAEGQAELTYSVDKFDQYDLHSLTPDRKWQTKFAWTMVDDEWLFASTKVDLIKHIKGRKKKDQFLVNDYAKEAYELGDKRGFGAPISIGYLNLPDILNQLAFWVDPMLEGDGKVSPDLDILMSDIPRVKELVNGVDSTYMSIFKTSNGYHVFQRQTYPGGTPPVTLAVMALGGIPTKMGTLAVQKKMHQLGQAHLAFEKKHTRFVGAHSLGKDGSHGLSWRVHLLPYLGYQELYDQFRLDEPWDSENNIKLVEKMPEVFIHPTLKLEKGKTAFLVPSSSGAVFDKSGELGELTPLGIKSDQIKDPRDQTALLLEVNKAASVVWTKPQDFDFDAARIRDKMNKIRDSRYFVFVLCNGEVRTGYYYSYGGTYKNVIDRNDGKTVKLPNMFGW